MKYIQKKDGYVYLVEEHDVYGRHRTITNLGKDIESELWKDEVESFTKKKNKKIENNCL